MMDNKLDVAKIWQKVKAIPQTSLLLGVVVIAFLILSLLLGVPVLFSFKCKQFLNSFKKSKKV